MEPGGRELSREQSRSSWQTRDLSREQSRSSWTLFGGSRVAPTAEDGIASPRVASVVKTTSWTKLSNIREGLPGQPSDVSPLRAESSRLLQKFGSMSHGAGGVLGGPHGIKPGDAGGADGVVSAIKSMRRASVLLNSRNTSNGSPNLNSKRGSLAFSFYAPHPMPGRGVLFSPDGCYMARYSYGPEVKVLRSSNGSAAMTLVNGMASIRYVTFNSTSRYLASASEDGLVSVWDLSLAEACQKGLVASISMGPDPVAYCTLSDDGQQLLTCFEEGELELWNVATGTLTLRYDVGHASMCAGINEEGRFVVACSYFDTAVTLLDLENGSIICTEAFDNLEEGRNKPRYAIPADGTKVLVYTLEKTYGSNLALYDTEQQTYITLHACNGALTHCNFSKDGNEFVAAGRDDQIHVFDATNGSLLVSLPGHSSDVLYCHVGNERKAAISGDNSGDVMVWDLESGDCALRLQGHRAPVVLCGLSADAKRAFSVDTEGKAMLWFIDMQSVFEVMRQYSEDMCCSTMVHNGTACLIGYKDGSLRLWQLDGLDTSVVWQHSSQHCTPVQCIAISPRRQYAASACRAGRITITDTSNGLPVASSKAHADVITSICYSPDGERIVTAARNGAICVWSQSDLLQAGCDMPETPTYGGAALNSTGARRAEASREAAAAAAQREQGKQQPAAANTVKPLLTLQTGSKMAVLSLAMCCYGKTLAAASACGSAFVWNANSGTLIHELAVTDLACSQVTYSEDARYLAAASMDGSVTVYDTTTGQQVKSLVGNASSVNVCYFEASREASSDVCLVSVCSRQAITWEVASASKATVADFILDQQGMFHKCTMKNRNFVAHVGVSMYDPTLGVSIYDMHGYEGHPGNSFLFRDGTALLHMGEMGTPLLLYTPPDNTITILGNESCGAKCLDFSSDGHLLVSGSLRGDLVIWDMDNKQQLHQWSAHKRSAITCVKFSHDASAVYSCGEDCKVVLWDWRTQAQMAMLAGHQAPVTSVEMSLDGSTMASGDKDGIIIIWSTESLAAKQIIPVHEGPVLCCSLSPLGNLVASSGEDEHICVLDAQTGHQLVSLDDALDGKGLTIKFSFDSTRLQVGGANGSILIWDIEKNALLYDIEAHEGEVFDCSWSGDSRRLLSVGLDGRARLWDAAAGAEICEANFERTGLVESGGFVRCDLSADGSTMAGCTAKGQLIQWEVGKDLRRTPDGSMLYRWLASMPLTRARDMYSQLLEYFPLVMNMQDSRGWTLLMHAAGDSNPEITKLIINKVPPRSGILGLVTSQLQNIQGASSHEHHLQQIPSLNSEDCNKPHPTASMKGLGLLLHKSDNNKQPDHQDHSQPNAISIALNSHSGDCVSHILDAVLKEKVTPGSYKAVTEAIPEVAEAYPTLCEFFLTRLPLKPLGEFEVPASIATQGSIVCAATSYTSYREMWSEQLGLDKVEKGPMVVMSAAMVRLPFAGLVGKGSVLHTLVEADVPVETFGSETVKAIIDFKWRKFAKKQIYTKSLVYLCFVLLFTVYAIIFTDIPTDVSFHDLWDASQSYGQEGRVTVVLSVILFFFGLYYMSLEAFQLFKLGPGAYFDSFWNFVDLLAYCATLVVTPCYLFRYGVGKGGFVGAVIALETILLWLKAMFFGLAIDGLGTFIYMMIEIVKGMRFFILLLFMLFISFGAAFMIIFRDPMCSPEDDACSVGDLVPYYKDVGKALLSTFMVLFGAGDPRSGYQSEWPTVAVALMSVYNVLIIMILLNMLITLMANIYKAVRKREEFVFLQGRAELIIEVESTMSLNQAKEQGNVAPYLHLLMPAEKQASQDDSWGASEAKDLDAAVAAAVQRLLGCEARGTSTLPTGLAPGAEGGNEDDDSSDDEDESKAGAGRALSVKSAKSLRSTVAAAAAKKPAASTPMARARSFATSVLQQPHTPGSTTTKALSKAKSFAAPPLLMKLRSLAPGVASPSFGGTMGNHNPRGIPDLQRDMAAMRRQLDVMLRYVKGQGAAASGVTAGIAGGRSRSRRQTGNTVFSTDDEGGAFWTQPHGGSPDTMLSRQPSTGQLMDLVNTATGGSDAAHTHVVVGHGEEPMSHRFPHHQHLAMPSRMGSAQKSLDLGREGFSTDQLATAALALPPIAAAPAAGAASASAAAAAAASSVSPAKARQSMNGGRTSFAGLPALNSDDGPEHKYHKYQHPPLPSALHDQGKHTAGSKATTFADAPLDRPSQQAPAAVAEQQQLSREAAGTTEAFCSGGEPQAPNQVPAPALNAVVDAEQPSAGKVSSVAVHSSPTPPTEEAPSPSIDSQGMAAAAAADRAASLAAALPHTGKARRPTSAAPSRQVQHSSSPLPGNVACQEAP